MINFPQPGTKSVKVKANLFVLATNNLVYFTKANVSSPRSTLRNIFTGKWTVGTKTKLRPYFIQSGDTVLLTDGNKYQFDEILYSSAMQEYLVKLIKETGDAMIYRTFAEMVDEFVTFKL